MKKLIAAALISVSVLPTVGCNQVGKPIAKQVVKPIAKQVVKPIAKQVVKPIAKQVVRNSTKGAVARVPIKAPEAAVYKEVHNAILSKVNKSFTQEVMTLAKKANQEQFKQTRVLLNKTAGSAIVFQAGAATAPGIKVAPSVTNLNQATEAQKAAVYQDVHRAILSKYSTQELKKLAEKANQEQFKQTGVLLKQTAVSTIVFQVGAATAPGIKKAQ